VNQQHFKYVIAGGGVTGSAAVEAIRRHDPRGSVLFVGQEVNRPYNRPALSKGYLLRTVSRTDLTALPIGWYAERHVELRTGRRLTHLDAARAAVSLDNGEEVSFDKLLLATGAQNKPLRIPGAELPNVYSLRTIEEADRLLHAVDLSKSAGRSTCCIVGGGLMGVELASTLAQAGMTVHLVESSPTLWPTLAGEITAQFVRRMLEAQGVTVQCGEGVERLEGDGRVQTAFTSAGRAIRCDFVVAAVGIQINREILRGTPIAAETAILVDQRCQTSVPHIYAAGDCAAVFDPLFGKHRLLDHWDNARITGDLAGTNMAGADAQYDAINYFWSELRGATAHVWGEPRQVYRRLLRGMPAESGGEFAEIGVAADGRVAQVVAFGRKSEHDQFRQLVGRRARVDGLEETIKDTAQQLSGLV
jgi:NADPH-dependent 2,4-dienoyl-CoA reductase/sulfur reductase-like enzyme